MKKFLTRTLLFAFCSIFCVPQAISQPGNLGPILNDVDGGGPYVLCLPNNLEGVYTPYLRVTVGNLDLFLPESEVSHSGQVYDYLPSGYSTMYLRYSVNNGPFERVDLSDVLFKRHRKRNGVYIYSALIETYPIQISNDCTYYGSFSYEMHLQQYIGEGEGGPDEEPEDYSAYPACDYTAPSDLFSCMIFIPAPYCGPVEDPELPPLYEECHLQDMTSKTGSIYYDCNCNAPDSEEYLPDSFIQLESNNITQEDNRRASGSLDRPDNSFLAMPNPFDQNLVLLGKDAKDVEQVSILDINGRLVYFNEINDKSDFNNLTIETKDFAKGIYFVKIKTSTSSEVIKVVKQ